MAWGLEHISSKEFAEWQAYYRLEPFGEERADIRAAMICKILADINTPKGKTHAKLEDFMPRFGAPEPQTPEDMLARVTLANAAFGGLDLREEDE